MVEHSKCFSIGCVKLVGLDLFEKSNWYISSAYSPQSIFADFTFTRGGGQSNQVVFDERSTTLPTHPCKNKISPVSVLGK